MSEIETRITEAAQLIGLVAEEYRVGDKAHAAEELKLALARLLVISREIQVEITDEEADGEADGQLVYHDGLIVVVPAEPDRWGARDTAVLIRPQGHCVDVFSPNGERWQV